MEKRIRLFAPDLIIACDNAALYFVVAHVVLSGQVDELANLLRTSVAKTVAVVLRLDHGLPLVQADPARFRGHRSRRG